MGGEEWIIAKSSNHCQYHCGNCLGKQRNWTTVCKEYFAPHIRFFWMIRGFQRSEKYTYMIMHVSAHLWYTNRCVQVVVTYSYCYRYL